MFYCEECRVKNNWPRPVSFPFCTISRGRCEVCNKTKDNYDVPARYLKSDKSKENEAFEKTLQDEFKRKAEELSIDHVYGPFAGRTNNVLTNQLRQIKIEKNGEVDWVATYDLRLKAQLGHYQQEELKRDRTIR